MYLKGTHPRLRRTRHYLNPRVTIVLLVLILSGLLVISGWRSGDIQPAFIPTPTATRLARSYAEEAEAQFAAGHLPQAIDAYEKARAIDTQNVDYWVALARIQIYARRYADALATAEMGLLVAPNNARTKAVYAWTLDWNTTTGCHCKTLAEAEAAAVQAIAIDGNYAPAHAYYSEILNDGQKWEQGSSQAQLALSLDPNSLDAHRAMGYANESVGNYEGAIEHYKDALTINPNLITIYISLGLNYRILQRYDEAIAAFGKANAIDPYDIEPYLALSRTYYQTDDFGAAVQYLQQALNLQPASADIHGRLGLIYFKAKNYEGAEPELRLAVFGGPLKDDKGNTVTDAQGNPVTVQGLPLNAGSLEFYYTMGNLMAYTYQCKPDQAPAILNQVLNFAPDNPTVIGSYEESTGICNNFLAGTLTPQPTPTVTPQP
jgi:tetratricopeptide (TPR) repeat protein